MAATDGSSHERTVVFLNPAASHGRGRERWTRVEAEVARRLGRFDIEETRPPDEMKDRAAELATSGVTRFVAAGGDGTVHLLANALMALGGNVGAAAEGAAQGGVAKGGAAKGGAGLPVVTMGAVGLGSSNDFHKPYGASDTIEGIPVHVAFDGARERDVIRVKMQGEAGEAVAYAVVNASIGVTAEANARFNESVWLVKVARAFSIDAAITAAVVSTLAGWRDIDCTISTDGADAADESVTNLGVYKNPHFGGELCYDLAPGPDDGVLGVALCEGMSIVETVRTLSALRRGVFSGRPKTRAWTARSLVVSAGRPFAVEMDGEVTSARTAAFGVADRRLRCCAGSSGTRDAG